MKYRDLYEDLYQNGYHGNYNISHTRKIYDMIFKNLKKGNKILDIGCANGTAVLGLRDNGYDSYGIDIATSAVEITKKRNIPNCFQASVCNLPFDDSYFDAIVSTDVLEHLDISEVDEALKSISRVLKGGGLIFLSIATFKERNRAWDNITKKYGLDNLHTVVEDSKFWIDKLSAHFKIVTNHMSKDEDVVVLGEKE